jgi:hypothetical protein
MTNLICRRNQFNPALKQLPQSIKRYALMSAFASLLPSLTFAACLPFDQARNHLDETQCVTGKVIRVQEGDRGVHYLDFCEDYRLCSFTVVVFQHDLQKIGDIRQLAGKVVEIRGEIKDYDDRAEIVLESSRQLNNGLMRLSPLPRSFDVEQRGHFSAGRSRPPHKRSSRKKKGIPTLPADVYDAESD